MTQTLTLNFPEQNIPIQNMSKEFIPITKTFTVWDAKTKQTSNSFVVSSTSRDNSFKKAYMNSYSQPYAKRIHWEETPLKTKEINLEESNNIVEKIVAWIGEQSNEIDLNKDFSPYVQFDTMIESEVINLGFIEPSFRPRNNHKKGEIIKFEKEIESKVELIDDFQFPSW